MSNVEIEMTEDRRGKVMSIITCIGFALFALLPKQWDWIALVMVMWIPAWLSFGPDQIVKGTERAMGLLASAGFLVFVLAPKPWDSIGLLMFLVGMGWAALRYQKGRNPNAA